MPIQNIMSVDKSDAVLHETHQEKARDVGQLEHAPSTDGHATKAVAVNIVENPLRVRLGQHSLRMVIVTADISRRNTTKSA